MVKSSARWPAEILAGPALLCSDSFSQQDVQIPSEADVTLLEVFFCSIPAGAHQSNKRPFCLGWICCGHLNSSLTLLPSGFSLVQHYYQQLFFLPRHWGEKKKSAAQVWPGRNGTKDFSAPSLSTNQLEHSFCHSAVSASGYALRTPLFWCCYPCFHSDDSGCSHTRLPGRLCWGDNASLKNFSSLQLLC